MNVTVNVTEASVKDKDITLVFVGKRSAQKWKICPQVANVKMYSITKQVKYCNSHLFKCIFFFKIRIEISLQKKKKFLNVFQHKQNLNSIYIRIYFIVCNWPITPEKQIKKLSLHYRERGPGGWGTGTGVGG